MSLTFTVKEFDDEQGEDVTISLNATEEEVEEAVKESEEQGPDSV